MSHHARSSRLVLGLAAVIVPVLAACSGDGSSESSGGGPASGLTYHRDAKPILDAKCTGCHTEGGIAPFALKTYDDVKANASAILGAIGAGTMPPWPPSADCSDYQGNRALSADQLATLTTWIKDGAPEGSAGDAPKPVDDEAVTLSRVDLELPMPVAYTPQKAPDDYRCFIVDWPKTDTTYVTGFGVEPGTPAIVHHVIAYLATPDEVAGYQQLDDAEPGPGYTCFGGPGSGRGRWIGGWAPGSLGADFPAGTGVEIPPGSKVIIQVHYNTGAAEAVPDQSKIALKIDPSVDKKALVVPWADPAWVAQKQMDIPAHATDATHSWAADPTKYMSFLSDGTIQSGAPLTVHTAGLHMHTLGTRALTRIDRADGSKECLLDIQDWNFHWQGSYAFSTPKVFNPGDQMYLECHWDNPGSTDVNWGEGTGDEMCLGIYYVTQ